MRKLRIPLICLLTVLAAAIISINLHAQEKETIYLVGATIYTSPEAPAIRNGVIAIADGRIKAVGEKKQIRIPHRSRQIDCSGKTIMAAFWNSHVHFLESKWDNAAKAPVAILEKQLQEMLIAYGYVYVLEAAALYLDNVLALRARIQNQELDGPEILVCSTPFVAGSGTPFYIKPIQLPEISTVDEAKEFVQSQIGKGVDGIKAFTASPTGTGIRYIPAGIIKAAVTSAHEAGKFIVAHPTNNNGAVIAINAGVDILVHTSPDHNGGWTDTLIAKMLQNKMALIPTLKLYKWELERENISVENNSLLITAKTQLGDFSKAGGEVLFGTDVGYMLDYSPADEYQFMSESGMNFQQILASLTTAPAKRFQKPGYSGKIEAGAVADIVVLDKDPQADPRHFAQVSMTVKKGKIIFGEKKW